MKMRFFATLAAFMILTLTGCGSSDHNNPPPVFVTDILSDSTFDGDIQLDSFSNLFTVSQGSIATQQRVFAGLDPFIDLEYRAFLHFPLTGVNGVPGDAVIESAFLDVFIDDIVTEFSTDTIPLRIDLVSKPSFLSGSDFDLLELLSISIRPPISLADLDNHVTIDVTPLMKEAQRLGLANFQIRVMEDFGIVTRGLIEINNTTGANRSILAPLLTVTYF